VSVSQTASTTPVGPEFCGVTHLWIASLGAHHRRTAEPALAACPGTCRVQSCRAHVNGLALPYLSSSFTHVANVLSQRWLRSASTNQLLVPFYRRSTIRQRALPRSCLERSSIWRYVCSVAGRRLKTKLFCRCYNAAWLFFTLIVVLEMDFLFRPL